MKNNIIALTLVGGCLATIALAQPLSHVRDAVTTNNDGANQQSPILQPSIPNSPQVQQPSPPNTNMSDPVIISDALPHTRTISIFAGLTRDIVSIASRFDNVEKNTTVLAPSNGAMMALPRKPWEDPEEYKALGQKAYEGDDGEARAKENTLRFVQAHVVPRSPWKEGEKVKTLQGGAEIWWEAKEGGVRVIQPHGIEVVTVADKVANGEVWVIKKVLNYAS